MLTLLLGTDWIANRNKVLEMIAHDVSNEKPGVVYMVPELISHDTERRLCAVAGDSASRFAEVITFTRLAKRVSDAVGQGTPECMDNGGRLVAMASATRVPEVHPSSGDRAPEKRSPGTAFCPGWETQFTGARQASLLQGKIGLTVPGGAGCQSV